MIEKKRFLSGFITIFVCIIFFAAATGVSAGERLIYAPTAELEGDSGFLAGETDGTGYSARGMVNLSPWLGLGANYDGNQTDMMARMVFVSEETDRPGIAAGVRREDVYLVFSKRISYGFSGHVGYGNGSMEGPFLGVRKVINPVSYSGEGEGFSLPSTDLVGEYFAGNVNLGAEFRFNSSLSVNVAVEDFSQLKGGFSLGF
ncbi:MAG: hypothetical protein ACOCZM_00240 [Bacillota bacterium]